VRRPTLRTSRLILRPLQVRDFSVWQNTCLNHRPQQNRWDVGPRPAAKCTRAEFNKLRKRHQDRAQKDDYYWFGVFEKKTGQLVGHIDFDIFVRSTHQFANYGYQIYNRFWGQGYGPEAALAGLQIGFQNLKLNRLEAAINLDNRKSIRLARNIGLRREGIKKRYWFEFGKWVDHLIYVANPEDLGLKAHKPF